MADPFILSPAGFIAMPNWPTVIGQQVGSPYTVVAPVQSSGGSVLAVGRGDKLLTQGSAVCGTLDAQITLPTAGTAESLAFLVDNTKTPVGYCGIYIDTSNRVGVKITNVLGTSVAAAVPSGAAGVAGTPVIVHMAWDARVPFVSLTVNGVSVPFTTNPSAPWTPFVPVALQLGVGNISGLSDFSTATGIKLVQVTSTSPVSIGRTYVAQVDVETIAMAAGSTMTASARVAHPLASAITGGATVVAVHS